MVAADGGDRAEAAAARGPGRLLWLLRHAKAVAAPPPGGTDHDRPLTPRGRRDAAALGRRLTGDRLGLQPSDLPQLVLCSTARRTAQTAEGAMNGLSARVDLRPALYRASPEEVLDEVREVDDAIASVMVVGHNPTIGRLVLSLIDDADEAGQRTLGVGTFPTCGVVAYRLAAERWQDVAEGSGSVIGWWWPPRG